MRDPHVRLTEEEQRRLAALEAALTAEDPQLARRLRSGRRLPVVGMLGCVPSRGLLGVFLVVAGATILIASFVTSTTVATFGCVAFAAGGYLTLSCDRSARIAERVDDWCRHRLFRSAREGTAESEH